MPVICVSALVNHLGNNTAAVELVGLKTFVAAV